MNWALKALGLGAVVEINQRTIKRAYAAKLKTTRPDEDPEGFQRLHEAYQAALEWAGEHSDIVRNSEFNDSGFLPTEVLPARHFEADSTEDVAPSLSLRGDAPSERQNIDELSQDDFDIETCLGIAQGWSSKRLRDWLNKQPALWSLEKKAGHGDALLRAIADHLPPMPSQNFELLSEFFGYNDLQSGYDPLQLSMLKQQLKYSWDHSLHEDFRKNPSNHRLDPGKKPEPLEAPAWPFFLAVVLVIIVSTLGDIEDIISFYNNTIAFFGG